MTPHITDPSTLLLIGALGALWLVAGVLVALLLFGPSPHYDDFFDGDG